MERRHQKSRLLPALMTFLCLFLLSSTAWAITVPPQPKGPLYDGANVLTPDQEKKLEKKLNGFRDNQGRPIVVAIIPSLEGDDIRSAGYDIAQGWGIGTKGKNDGVLLLLVVDKAKKAGPGAKKCGCAAIEVGEYLEGDLTDSTVVQILKKEVLAPVVSGKFYEAADGGSKGIMAVLGGDAEAAKAYKNSSDGGGDDYSWFFELHWFLQLLLVLLAIFVLVIFLKFGGGGSGGGYGGGSSWGGGSSGGGSSGGSSFGGGSFGGGGGSV
jgi:uncharacterized protein